MKMSSKSLYCEYGFLEDFSKSYPEHNPIPIGQDPVESWRKAFQFIYYSKSTSYIGGLPSLSENDYLKMQKENQLLWLLIKGVKTSKFKSIKEILNSDFDDEKTNSVYLTTETKRGCVELSQQYGVLVLGKQDLLDFENIFKERTISVPKGQKYKSWQDVEFPLYANISNAIIIQDNYILSKELNKDNLFSILEVLLPERSLMPFHISIFTIIESSKAKTEYENLINRLKEIRKDLPIKLTIYNVHKDEFHARRILTNTLFIKSEIGFDIFNKCGARMETDVLYFFPFFFSSETNNLVENLIDGIRRVEKRGLTYEFNYWGEKGRDNRLLSFLKSSTPR